MIKRTFEQSLKSLRPHFKNVFKTIAPFRSFSTVNVDGLKTILKNEINHEETNYTPVDQNELKTFYSNTKFHFTEQPDALSMELTKSQGNYDVIINFQAKPPVPQDEQGGDEQEKGKKNN